MRCCDATQVLRWQSRVLKLMKKPHASFTMNESVILRFLRWRAGLPSCVSFYTRFTGCRFFFYHVFSGRRAAYIVASSVIEAASSVLSLEGQHHFHFLAFLQLRGALFQLERVHNDVLLHLFFGATSRRLSSTKFWTRCWLSSSWRAPIVDRSWAASARDSV